MVIEKPYHMEINDKWQAYNAIMNMCSNCPRLLLCTGAESVYCNKVKDKIRITFTSLRK